MAVTADASEVLLEFAEIAVALAGFSSIVGIFQRGSGPGGAPFDLFRFWIMLEFSLAALLFALLPFPLLFLGLAEATVWAACSAAMVAFVVLHTVVSRRLIRRREPVVVSSLTRGLSAGAFVVLGVIVFSQVLNVAGVLGRSVGPYLLAVFLLLVAAGVNFVRLVWVGNPPLTR